MPQDCVIATSTNDGGGDERKSAFQLVKEGNDIWCCAHQIQLCIDDCLDSKKAKPPIECADHRSILKKAHDLVVFINGHRDTLQAFTNLASSLRMSGEGLKMWLKLILDQDTRWDSDFMMLERVVYFDPLLRQLFLRQELSIPAECIFRHHCSG